MDTARLAPVGKAQSVGANDHIAVDLPPETIYRGNLSLLNQPLTALFCSNRCPGDLILKTYDLARAKLADSGKPLLTLESPANANLVGMGAEVLNHISQSIQMRGLANHRS